MNIQKAQVRNISKVLIAEWQRWNKISDNPKCFDLDKRGKVLLSPWFVKYLTSKPRITHNLSLFFCFPRLKKYLWFWLYAAPTSFLIWDQQLMLLCNLAPLFITMTWAYRNFYRVPSRYVELLIKSWVLWTQRGLDSPPPSFYKLSSKWQFLFKLLLIIRNLTMSRYCILLHVIYSSTSIRCFHFIGFIILALSKFISNIIYHYCSLLVDRSKFDKIPSYSQKLGM